jgi:hypothetical protein
MTDYISELEAMLAELQRCNFTTYDHYDFWGSDLGVWLRKLNRTLAFPLLGGFYLLDTCCPKLIRLYLKKTRSPEVIPYYIRGYLYLRSVKGGYEEEILALYKYLLSVLGHSPHGVGLGLQFNWYTEALIPAFTPCVTVTSYFVDITIELFKAGLISDLAILKQVGEFVYHDLHYQQIDDERGRISYTDLDKRFVINANSYGARIMLQLGNLFSNELYKERAGHLLRYVIGQQNEDGSWFYFDKDSCSIKNNFIDCFHSAYVIENLLYAYSVHKDTYVLNSLDKAMNFFKNQFVSTDHNVKHFAKSHLPYGITTDIRSNAEAVSLLGLMSCMNRSYIDDARKVLETTFRTMYDFNSKYFYFRKYPVFTSKMNYQRWGLGPMINGIVNYVGASAKLTRKET